MKSRSIFFAVTALIITSVVSLPAADAKNQRFLTNRTVRPIAARPKAAVVYQLVPDAQAPVPKRGDDRPGKITDICKVLSPWPMLAVRRSLWHRIPSYAAL
ncbi:hypothetical protein QFZ35_003035 [Arthrobacter ulcerisalmonis]|nr:hypothetical protein [Arthrobacter ulcerisalmonis]